MTDQAAATIVLAVIALAWTAANRGWASRWTSGWTRHREGVDTDVQDTQTPRSNQQDARDDPELAQVSTTGPLRPAQRLVQPLAAPVRALPDHPQQDPSERQPYETGPRWARRQIEAGLLGPGEIDCVGAEKFAVDERTVRRWRKAVGDDRKPTTPPHLPDRRTAEDPR